ncbi:MarR family winged helix-turn-helix transcriptional regulator [Jeotgalibacillus proteolyticus]|uniref:MarR family winged helix-turn-helix transcriptional regulator n=1 Tax=Jeotgalibacillus proteolyticus TaxID=2082395 RepID=UPI003CF33A50
MSKVSELNRHWTDIYFHLHYPHKEKISHQVVRILQLVDKKEGVGMNDIASHIQVSQNTASEHVKRIIEKKFLTKERDTIDERKVMLRLTDSGRDVLHRNTSLDEEKLERVWDELDTSEKEMVEQAFKLVSKRAKKCFSS